MVGQILIEIGQSEVAVVPLKKARQINPDNLDKARDFCLRALEISPGHPFFLQTWQNIRERLDEEGDERISSL